MNASLDLSPCAAIDSPARLLRSAADSNRRDVIS